jgi:hypothetical protein
MALKLLRPGGVYEPDGSAKLGKGVMEELIGAAVKVVGGYYLIAQLSHAQQSKGDGRHTG